MQGRGYWCSRVSRPRDDYLGVELNRQPYWNWHEADRQICCRRGFTVIIRASLGGVSHQLTAFETTQLLLDEWKFRQAHCWRLLQIYGLAAIVVSIAPYLSTDPRLLPYLPRLAWLGWGLELFVAWLFAAEYVRCYRRGSAYDALISASYDTLMTPATLLRPWKGLEWLFWPKIGWVIPGGIVLISSIILALKSRNIRVTPDRNEGDCGARWLISRFTPSPAPPQTPRRSPPSSGPG